MATDNESRKRRRGPSDVRVIPAIGVRAPTRGKPGSGCKTLLPTDSHRRSEISVVGQLLEHEIGDIGARDAVRPKKVAQVRPVTITAARRAIRQHRGPDNHPIDAAFCDQFFLPHFVPENEGQNQRDDEERVKQAETSDAVADSERALADEARHIARFHRAQNVARALEQNLVRIKPTLMTERADDRVLPAHRRLHRRVVEHVAFDDT